MHNTILVLSNLQLQALAGKKWNVANQLLCFNPQNPSERGTRPFRIGGEGIAYPLRDSTGRVAAYFKCFNSRSCTPLRFTRTQWLIQQRLHSWHTGLAAAPRQWVDTRETGRAMDTDFDFTGYLATAAPGQTWEEVKLNAERLPEGLRWRLALELIQAVAVLERQGFVHGDLSPGNILVHTAAKPGEQALHIIDFDAFALPYQDHPPPLCKADGGTYGTPGYCPRDLTQRDAQDDDSVAPYSDRSARDMLLLELLLAHPELSPEQPPAQWDRERLKRRFRALSSKGDNGRSAAIFHLDPGIVFGLSESERPDSRLLAKHLNLPLPRLHPLVAQEPIIPAVSPSPQMIYPLGPIPGYRPQQRTVKGQPAIVIAQPVGTSLPRRLQPRRMHRVLGYGLAAACIGLAVAGMWPRHAKSHSQAATPARERVPTAESLRRAAAVVATDLGDVRDAYGNHGIGAYPVNKAAQVIVARFLKVAADSKSIGFESEADLPRWCQRVAHITGSSVPLLEQPTFSGADLGVFGLCSTGEVFPVLDDQHKNAYIRNPLDSTPDESGLWVRVLARNGAIGWLYAASGTKGIGVDIANREPASMLPQVVEARQDELRLKQAIDRADAVRVGLRSHSLSRYASNAVSNLTSGLDRSLHEASVETPRGGAGRELIDYTAASVTLLGRLDAASNALSRLKERRREVGQGDVEQYANAEWGDFMNVYDSIDAQTNIADFTSAVGLADDRLGKVVLASQVAKANWERILKARDEASGVLAAIGRSPVLAHARDDVDAIERDYSNVVARLNPGLDASQQISELSRTTSMARDLRVRMELAVAQSAILDQFRQNLGDEITTLRQFAPARVNEAERLLESVQSAGDLSTYTVQVARATQVICDAFDESDAARRGTR
jgi:hypothetical protein